MHEGLINPEELHSLGKQILSVAGNCKPKVIRNLKRIKKIMIAAAKAAHATIVRTSFTKAKGSRVIIGVVIIAESHLIIKTDLKTKSAAIDVFTCGDTMIPEVAMKYVVSKIRGTIIEEYINKRGSYSGPYKPHKTEIPKKDLQLAA